MTPGGTDDRAVLFAVRSPDVPTPDHPVGAAMHSMRQGDRVARLTPATPGTLVISTSTRGPNPGLEQSAAGAARDRFGIVHQQTPGFSPGSATLSGMALLRRKPREASTTEANGVGPTAPVVKVPRTARKPKAPKTPEIVEQPPVADEIEPTAFTRQSVLETHDDEW